MKKIFNVISLLLIVICTITCKAQHVTDPEADKFVGTWKWGDNTNGLTIIMKKETNVKPFGTNNPLIWDGIVGFHKLIKNGLAIDDYLSFSNTSFLDRKYSFTGNVSVHGSNPNILMTAGRHKGKSIEISIHYIDSTHIKITEVQNMSGTWARTENQPPRDWSIDIPVNIILTKQ